MSDATETPPPPEEPTMEIHKPKSVHSWREFLAEIGVVVIGVCIAIGLEQSVEWLHWQSEVSIARKALASEIADDDINFARRVAAARCLDRKLDRISQMIADIASGQQPRALVTRFNGMGSQVYDNDWQAERSSQILTHFPREELALMTRYYSELPGLINWQQQEGNAWTQLAILSDAPQKLSPGDLVQLRSNYHLARRFAYVVAFVAGRQLEISDRLGIKHASVTVGQNDDSCGSTGAQTKF
jgi:hypothetical protein